MLKFAVKNDSDSFYNAPGMVGHRWAAETLDDIEALFAKVVRTKQQRALVNLLVDFDSTSWHYFCGTTKKEITIWSYILRRWGKVDPLTLLNWHNNKPGCLKTRLTHILEVMAFVSTKSPQYKAQYIAARKWYGMAAEDAEASFYNYHRGLDAKHGYKNIIAKELV